MEDFEQRSLAETSDPPHWWKRYVDDTYTVLKKDKAQAFTKYLNTIDDDIKWMTEGEVQEEIEVENIERKWRDACLSWTLDQLLMMTAPSEQECLEKQPTQASTLTSSVTIPWNTSKV